MMDCLWYGEDCNPDSLEECEGCGFYKSTWTECPFHPGVRHRVTEPCPRCMEELERVPA